VALVGEAAGFVSPSSAEGISYALDSAALLARALGPGLSGWAERYRTATGPLRRSLLVKTLKVPFLYAPPLRRLAMWSGLLATPVGAPPPLAATAAAR
jgi:flavin-dependent dehydrogenase